ncbi:spore germination protein GerPE [Pontibacillus litoralis]|uniref:Spore germination protein n=1 Tax=Pontibacillus litoralis JSM 072002 TaxID=1385512 RepID=A0A0A5G9K3_9BACI|nr:spore germination protein GerPE [Pontibacillus litoralis]KGX87795.1 spore germination protein [Pontibacillus litoralis JSM 072002]
MDKRTSRVKQAKVISLLNSAIFEIGDGAEANLQSKALAIQKEGATFTGEEFSFSDFDLFKIELPQFKTQPAIEQNHLQQSPYIDVENVEIIGVASSSLFQIGSLESIESESRIKHFRILRE